MTGTKSPKSTAAGAAARAGRPGRPPASAAGEVDGRILDAATEVFLERGFGRATFDEIAARAGAGKASLYSRYKAKDELLTAVVRRSVDRVLLLSAPAPGGTDARERLRQVGFGMVEHTLQDEPIALMRLVIAEGAQFPELGRHAHRMARGRSVDLIGRAILGDAALEAGGPAREVVEAADLFLDTVFMPFAMRALMGEDVGALRARIRPHVEAAVGMLDWMGALGR